MPGLRALILLLASLVPAVATGQTILLMAEEKGCVYCARWNKDISGIYPKTPEGRAAPLQRYDLAEGTPDGVKLARRVSFTPTFILVTDGKEMSRIEGYPGEDFFWGLMGQMLQEAQVRISDEG